MESAPRVAELGIGDETVKIVQQLIDISAQSTAHLLVVTLIFLSCDTEAKRSLIEVRSDGPFAGTLALDRHRARNFFAWLDPQILLPWLTDNRCDLAWVAERAKELYLVA